MIGQLRGLLIERQLPTLTLEVNGLGYEVEVPLATFTRLPAQGAEARLFIHLVAREDAQQLYGFDARPERDLFRGLLRVSGVGPKAALAILSGMDAQEFARCVTHEDLTALTRVPGIGKRTAERLLVDMRDRLAQLDIPQSAPGTPGATVTRGQLLRDAEAALISLGFKPQDAAAAIAAVDDDTLPLEALVKAALRRLA